MTDRLTAAMKLSCSDCGSPITKRARTERCHPCSARIQGRKNVESGQLVSVAVKGGRIGGPMGARNQPREAKVRGGRIATESGQLASAGARGAPIGGRIQGPIQGRKNIESGHIAAIGRIRGRIAVETGQLARISRGVSSTADGILFHSQTEALFYCVAQELGGEPRANPPRIDLPDGRSYFPDFILGRSILGIPANVPIELKPARNAFYQKNLPKAIEAGAFVVYWDELAEK